MEKNPAVAAILAEGLGTFVFVPGPRQEGRVVLQVQRGGHIDYTDNGVRITGPVWVMRWGDKRPIFGHLKDCLIPIDLPDNNYTIRPQNTVLTVDAYG